jgi:carbonic anhydrase
MEACRDEMPTDDDVSAARPTQASSLEDSLSLLKEGNARFARGDPLQPHVAEERSSSAQGQAPFAIVFGCVDPRVPPEIVFGRGLGDLLVVRTAGQVIDEAVLGSIEFGAAVLGIPLVVVLGHEDCGAVIATIEALRSGTSADGSVATIVEAIAPAVERVTGDDDELLDRATRNNIRNVVARLRKHPVLSELEGENRLAFVGAHYDVSSGVADFMADQ